MKKKYKVVISFIFITLLLLIIQTKVEASSFTISVGKSTLNVGDTTQLTVSGGEGNFSFSSSNNSVVSVSSSKGTSTTLKAQAEGSATITVTGNNESNNENVTETTGSQSVTITVNKSTSNSNTSETVATATQNEEKNNNSENTSTKSSDATLKNLGITPNDFSGFKPNTMSYNVTVKNNVSSVKVYAEAKDSKAKVTGTGNKKLEEGKNVAKVTVTAEDGTTKTYTINITREKSDVEEKQEENTTQNKSVNEITNLIVKEEGLTDIEISGYILNPQFKKDVYEYTLNIPSDVEKLDMKLLTSSDDIETEIIGNEQLQNSENVITILVKGKDSEETTTYQIIVNKSDIASTVNGGLDKQKIFIGIVATIIVILIIIFIIIKRNKKTDYELDEDLVDSEDEMPVAIKTGFANRNNFNNIENKEENKNELEESNYESYKVKENNEVSENLEDTEYLEEILKTRKKGKHF